MNNSGYKIIGWILVLLFACHLMKEQKQAAFVQESKQQLERMLDEQEVRR